MEALSIFIFSITLVSMFVARRPSSGSLESNFFVFAWIFCASVLIASIPREVLTSHAAPAFAPPAFALRLALVAGAVMAVTAFLFLSTRPGAPVRRRVSLRTAGLFGVCAALPAFAPAFALERLESVAAIDMVLMQFASAAFFAFARGLRRTRAKDFERIRVALAAGWLAICAGLYLCGRFAWPAFFAPAPHIPAPLLLVPLLPGLYLALRFAKHAGLLWQLQRDCADADLLFEERYDDLCRGLRALREVLLDRKIESARRLVLNAEESLTIQRGSILPEEAAGRTGAGRDDFAWLERHRSLVAFTLRPYAPDVQREGHLPARGLRIHDPLLVLYHYLARPEAAFAFADALDVIEREELRELMKGGLVERRSGAGLRLSGKALARIGGQTNVLTG